MYDPERDILAFNEFVSPWEKSDQTLRVYTVEPVEGRFTSAPGMQVAHRIDNNEVLLYFKEGFNCCLAVVDLNSNTSEWFENIFHFVQERMIKDHEQYDSTRDELSGKGAP